VRRDRRGIHRTKEVRWEGVPRSADFARDDELVEAGDEATREGDQARRRIRRRRVAAQSTKAGEFVAVLPGEMEKFFGVEMGGFLAQEGFETPLEIGTVPGLEAIAPGGNQ